MVERNLVSTLLIVLAGLIAQQPQAQVIWVQGGPYHLKASVFQSAEVSATPVLVVVLHGDSPFGKPDYQDRFAAEAANSNTNVVAVALLRPGYTDPKGNSSEGERGQTTGDNYNAKNTDAIAAAIGELKDRYHSQRVVVAGHSGGASITANILGRHPELIDAALIVSCPCDVDKWRAHMFETTKFAGFKGSIETLSPQDLIEGISNSVPITMVTGSKDDVAPPALSEAYRAAAVRLGKQVRLVTLPGGGHEIFLETAVQAELKALLH